MSLYTMTDAELQSLVKWSPQFCDRAQAELDRRAAAYKSEEQRGPVRAAHKTNHHATERFATGRWS